MMLARSSARLPLHSPDPLSWVSPNQHAWRIPKEDSDQAEQLVDERVPPVRVNYALRALRDGCPRESRDLVAAISARAAVRARQLAAQIRAAAGSCPVVRGL
jgi:hypothetical protein